MKFRTRILTSVLLAVVTAGIAWDLAYGSGRGNNAASKQACPTRARQVAAKPSPSRQSRPVSSPRMQPTQRDIIQTAVGPGMQTVTTLVQAVQAAELVDALRSEGPFTVFAPTNDAFAKLPAGMVESLLQPENRDQLRSILLYHVHAGEAIRASDLRDGELSTVNGQSLEVSVDGPTVMVDGATVAKTDVMASNGVIHWIDSVILPSRTEQNEQPQMQAMQPASRDIIQTAVGPGMQTVTTLVKAVQAAELVDALRGEGPFTVFAPTNDAFAKLPAGTVQNLLEPENQDQLRSILLYHVHAGEAIRAADLRDGELSTLNGQSVDIGLDGPTVTVDGATVTKTDVVASNGVIHWIDTVILP